jgi:intracellular sulfur oxidation DsrE/DsrF family protein
MDLIITTQEDSVERYSCLLKSITNVFQILIIAVVLVIVVGGGGIKLVWWWG